MPASADDWRRMGQEQVLPPGTALVRKPYRAHSGSWEHDHCEFCGAKFMDAEFSEEHRRAIEADPEILTSGYATTAEHERGADYYWVCTRCFEDLSEEFGWTVVAE